MRGLDGIIHKIKSVVGQVIVISIKDDKELFFGMACTNKLCIIRQFHFDILNIVNIVYKV